MIKGNIKWTIGESLSLDSIVKNDLSEFAKYCVSHQEEKGGDEG